VRTLKNFQGTQILGASRGLLCDSSAVLLLQVTGTTHNVVGLVNNTMYALVLFTSPDAVAVDVVGTATASGHNKRGDASIRLIGTTNPQQIEVGLWSLRL